MDKNEFAQAELVALRKGLEEASKIIEALEAENAALKAELAAREPVLSEDEKVAIGVCLSYFAKGHVSEKTRTVLRNLLERTKR